MKRKTITQIVCAVALISLLPASGWAFRNDCNGEGMRGDGPMGARHEHRMDRMADILDLTEAQQKQIDAIHEQERATFEADREQRREIHEQMRALIESDNFDEAAIRNLATKEAEMEIEQRVSRAKVRNQVFNILTPEQQELSKKLGPMHGERGGKHHRGGPGPGLGMDD
ncbi:MAG: hypothetical protein C0615_00430 [Desulfuromonas sp.]|nr:MAG: hypothetical protein C0615_00430 [Desulfuromonas sp.]